MVLAAGLVSANQGPAAAPVRGAAGPALNQPSGLALDAQGTLFVSDLASHSVLKLSGSGVLTRVAGTGEGGFSGDGGPAATARLFAPHDLAVDAGGNLLVADTYNHRIRRIDRNGIITTIAGNGRDGYRGDGGPARAASLNNPQGIALDTAGTLYIADTYNHVVRRVAPSGTISTFAGTEPGLAGDGGPAARAQLSLPTAVAVARDGSVYISEAGNNRIRRVSVSGVIETIAGFGPGSGTAGAGYGGDGGPAEKARLFAPMDIDLWPLGDLVISDSGNQRVRGVSQGVINTLAGTGERGFRGDGGKAVEAALSSPQKLALGPDGGIYLADRANHRVRQITPGGTIVTVWGDDAAR
ncbi:MAG: repeat containing protein [Armatimonadetes bacterium]|jgi:sugar lactone lactonase YvrE|nr:repeat containing protein [Armatimonadota bacterium]